MLWISAAIGETKWSRSSGEGNIQHSEPQAAVAPPDLSLHALRDVLDSWCEHPWK